MNESKIEWIRFEKWLSVKWNKQKQEKKQEEEGNEAII